MTTMARITEGMHAGITGEVVNSWGGESGCERVTIATVVGIDIDVPAEDLQYLDEEGNPL